MSTAFSPIVHGGGAGLANYYYPSVATVYSLLREPSLALLRAHGYTFRMLSHHHIHPLLRTREGEVK